MGVWSCRRGLSSCWENLGAFQAPSGLQPGAPGGTRYLSLLRPRIPKSSANKGKSSITLIIFYLKPTSSEMHARAGSRASDIRYIHSYNVVVCDYAVRGFMMKLLLASYSHEWLQYVFSRLSPRRPKRGRQLEWPSNPYCNALIVHISHTFLPGLTWETRSAIQQRQTNSDARILPQTSIPLMCTVSILGTPDACTERAYPAGTLEMYGCWLQGEVARTC